MKASVWIAGVVIALFALLGLVAGFGIPDALLRAPIATSEEVHAPAGTD